jgi:glutamate-1-semialdehyde aminotransferase
MLVTERGGELVPELHGLRPGVTEDVRLVPFNDPDALERALAPGDVACVLAEPAMTNVGVIQPEPGFHAALRERTRAAGSLLVLDETHTLICGPGGLVRAWELEPDVVTLGKSIGAGVPIGAYGMTEDVVAPLDPAAAVAEDGIAPEVATGGTLFGNALSMAAARAALAEVLVDEAYERATALGARVADGIEREARRAGLRWRADRLGPRSGYVFGGSPPRDAEDSRRGHDAALHRLLRLWMANRSVWEAMEWAGPAMSVAATATDVDHYLAVLRDLVTELAS